MKQTAVELVIEKIKKAKELPLSDLKYEEGHFNALEGCLKLLEHAKDIEKQQIIDANIAGMEFIAVDVNKYNHDAEQYYNETFKNK